MKIHVCRGHHRSFEEATIELDTVEEWSTISIALLEQMNLWLKRIDEWSDDAQNIQYAKQQYERFKKAYGELDVKNEIPSQL